MEIEFACNLSARDDGSGQAAGELYLLQIRPIVDSKQVLDEDLAAIPDEQCLLRSKNSLGHGISEDVCDVVYVKAGDDFTAVNNPMIADQIEQINRRFLDADKNYVLIGPGRWGGYFTINTYTGDGVFQKEVLDAMPAVEETEYVRHVRFDHPLKIMMDGKKQQGVIIYESEPNINHPDA